MGPIVVEGAVRVCARARESGVEGAWAGHSEDPGREPGSDNMHLDRDVGRAVSVSPLPSPVIALISASPGATCLPSEAPRV